MKIRVGTSGFSYNHWQGIFYPDKLSKERWLEFYAERFDSVEINSSFYHLPRASTLEAWRRRTPAYFVFVLKGNRFVTHRKNLKDCEDTVKQFYDLAGILKNKLAAVLWQLPPQLNVDTERLQRFLAILSSHPPVVLEFRNHTWYTEEVYSIMQRYNVSLCLHDMPSACCPDIAIGPLLYLRFHGPDGRYGGSYSNEFLMQRAKVVKNLAKGDIYAFFNNDFGGHAVSNARTFRGYLNSLQ